MSATVTIIDYGSGNLLSVARAVERAGGIPHLTSDPAEIYAAEHLLLPGVGAFEDGMRGLQQQGLVEPVRAYALAGRPIMGICLGMQMLATCSEEFGEHPGLDIIPGRVLSIPTRDTQGDTLKIPHIGWAELLPPDERGWCETLFDSVAEKTSMYLVHSFHMIPKDPLHILAVCEYGGHKITAAVQYGRVVGCQFHPEKSGPDGIAILRAFMRL